MNKILYCILSILAFTCCEKQIEVGQTPQRQSSYNKAFEVKIGVPDVSQEWGDWYLRMPSETRVINNDTTTWHRFREVPYPSKEDINDVILAFGKPYDGINMVNVPKGDYWVKTIYKNDYFFYTDALWHISFHGYDEMSSISIYNQSEKKYESINNIDSLALIECLDEYDGVIPQFAYYNELYSENYFEQRTIEYNGVYYVGFDFFVGGFYKSDTNTVTQATMVDERDFIYDDWVIMLIPAYRFGQEKIWDEKRVMCEDFSNSNDFDFNDLVYDVALVDIDGELKTKITIQAVGTKDVITINNVKVHDLFKINDTYINTDSKYSRVEPKSFYMDKVTEDIRDIEVSMFYDNKLYFLDNKKGNPTHRICVSTNTKWGYEGYAIWGAYPQFKDWITHSKEGWESDYRAYLLY